MSRIWIADTCALIEVRRCVVPKEKPKRQRARKEVFKKLGGVVDEGRLIFPPETVRELRDGAKKIEGPDHPFDFVSQHEKHAVQTPSFDTVKELGANPLVRRVVDVNAEKEEADIYVLALALDLQENGEQVGVLTQERKDLPAKLSMTTAAGLLGLVALPMPAFLAVEGIWALPNE